ncbi:MAG: HAD-IIIA family hydrolase [Candidatus Tectomicrobia bacterium]|nr:HAD-IIIA family hydrolase [Candidatus Tectomicrobia bacterium]
MKKGLFLDLGGTLIRIEDDEIYRDKQGKVALLPGVREKLSRLTEYAFFIMTNQSGIARGTLTESEVIDFIRQTDALLGHLMTDYRYCPHHPDDRCPCRKPRPGMILDLAREHDIDLSLSVMVGDSEDDRKCAENAEIPTFFWAHEFFSSESP